MPPIETVPPSKREAEKDDPDPMSRLEDEDRPLSPLEVPALRAEMLNRVVPSSLLPMAAANAMLILGASKRDDDCFFNLKRGLVWTGAIGLSMVILGTVGRYVVRWILESNRIRRGDRIMVRILELLGALLTACQICVLSAGTLAIFPRLHQWQFKHRHLPNYCDFSMVVFTTSLIAVTWIMVVVALASAIYIHRLRRRDRPEE